MRILLTTVSLDARKGGGTTERTRQMARHLAAAGHHCSVATIENGARASGLRQAGVEVYATGFVRFRVSFPLIRPGRLYSMVRDADAVHILGYWNMLSVVTAACARLAGRPYLLSAAGEFASLRRPRLIARVFHHVFGRSMIRNAAALVAITESEKTEIIERLAVPADRVFILPNGIETSSDSAPAAQTLPHPYIAFVGRLAEIKGPDLLVDAFSRICQHHPDVTLVIAGSDFGLERKLRRDVQKWNISHRVRFVGHVAEADRTALYSGALFLAVPSRAEAMSLVAIEAGIAGTPVVVTDQCGLDEVTRVGGGAVCAANSVAIAETLDMMLAVDDLEERGCRWRDHVLKNYTWPRIIREFLNRAHSLTCRP